MTPEQLFGFDLAGWTVIERRQAGVLRAYAILNGVEIHYATLPGSEDIALSRKMIRDFLCPLLEHRGYLTTRATLGTDTSFIERLGFTKTWCDGAVTYFILTALPFSKKDN
jgi:hypothetical protein